MAMERENRTLTIGPLGLEVHYLSIYWACAQAKNKNLPEEEKSSSKKIALINKRRGLIVIASESVPRMKTSSAIMGRGPGRWFDGKDDNPRNLVRSDKHCRGIR